MHLGNRRILSHPYFAVLHVPWMRYDCVHVREQYIQFYDKLLNKIILVSINDCLPSTADIILFLTMLRTSLLGVHRLASRGIARYATAANKPSGGSNLPLFIGLTAVAGVGGYYYYTTQQSNGAPRATTAVPPTALNPEAFVPFRLESVKDISPNTRLFRFALQSPEQQFGLDVASCVVARVPEDGKEDSYIIRPYTPISPREQKGSTDFVIKVYPDGKMTQKLFKLKPGDTLEMKGPIPKIKYEPNKYQNIGMIAGGTGIAPMIQVLREIFNNPQDKTKVSLLFGNITEEDILLRGELEALEKQFPDRFQVYYTLDKPPKDWKFYQGYVDEQMVKETMPAPVDGNIIMVCGPPPMLKSICGPKGPNFTQGEVSGILKALGYKENHVFKF
jgi:cytochrome-b5 reductase